MEDLVLGKSMKRGSIGNKVKLIQEWLCLHGFNIAIDKDFGPATDYAVKEFQKKKKLKVDGIVGKNTFGQLILPMTDALKPFSTTNKSVGRLVVDYANQHLRQHPREIGGQNMGPWVRLYMNGREGPDKPWCAGFVSFILNQACQTLAEPLPIKTSVSCDVLAERAKQKRTFISEARAKDRKLIGSGSFFLVRKTAGDWTHTGIVLRAEEELFHTIEGNTNDEGNREGYEVCKRVRGYKNKDFILM